jgi:hypothetical protein
VAGSPFNHTQRFDQGIRECKVELAWMSAKQIADLSLDRALSLTLLLADQRDERYERAAARFLARFVSEARPTLQQASKLADALDCVWSVRGPPAVRAAAQNALEDLRCQLSDDGRHD